MQYQKQGSRVGITRHIQRAILVAIARLCLLPSKQQAIGASSSNRKRPSVRAVGWLIW